MKSVACAFVVCLLLAMLAGPLAAASISGTITPPGKVVKLVALSRKADMSGGKVYKKKLVFPEFPAKFDRATGKFTIPNLKNGRYDLVITLAKGRIEGYHFRLDRDYRRDDPLTDKHRQGVIKGFEKQAKVSRFCNKARVLGFDGNAKYVQALVEKARTRDFHSGKGQAVWRVEMWIMVNHTSEWKVHTSGRKTFYRFRYENREDFSKVLWLFDPKLGGIRITKGQSVEGFQYTIPDKWDKSLGKTPGFIFDEAL